MIDYTLSGETEWETVSIAVPVEGRAGTIRLFLPAGKAERVEVRSIRVEGADGARKEWRFGE